MISMFNATIEAKIIVVIVATPMQIQKVLLSPMILPATSAKRTRNK